MRDDRHKAYDSVYSQSFTNIGLKSLHRDKLKKIIKKKQKKYSKSEIAWHILRVIVYNPGEGVSKILKKIKKALK
jgi:hypothetical protein